MAITNTNLPVTITPFPPGTCFQTDQDLANAIAAAIRVTLPGTITPWNVGPNQPAVNDRDKPWLKTDDITNTIVGIFNYSPTYGNWVQNHWLLNGNNPPLNERRIFVGTLSDLETFDGGEPGTISASTGPFWIQAEAAFTGGVPVGVPADAAIAPLGTEALATIPATGSPNVNVVGVYFIQPSGRIFDRGA